VGLTNHRTHHLWALPNAELRHKWVWQTIATTISKLFEALSLSMCGSGEPLDPPSSGSAKHGAQTYVGLMNYKTYS